MNFPERFSALPEYPFPRLRALLGATEPGDAPVQMALGAPGHDFPDWLGPMLGEHVAGFRDYPANEGEAGLLRAIADWIARRYGVALDPGTQLMALNGSREGLFNAALALCPEQSPRGQRPAVLIPNPFYQVYAVAAAAVGAEPVFVPASAENGHLPDYAALTPELLNRVALAYICSPSNPEGAVADRDAWAGLIALAEKYDFRILADECYSEIYRDAPPPGVLEVAAEGGADPERVLAFNSLSKRSNLAGLRSGFVAGGPRSIARIRRLRAYAGAPLPGPVQKVSAALWADEAHVEASRALYREKYALADRILGDLPGYRAPGAGFFLWLEVGDGEQAALKLWREAGVRVLPGAYLAREVDGANPGKGHIRVALVAPITETRRGLGRIRDCLYH